MWAAWRAHFYRVSHAASVVSTQSCRRHLNLPLLHPIPSHPWPYLNLFLLPVPCVSNANYLKLLLLYPSHPPASYSNLSTPTLLTRSTPVKGCLVGGSIWAVVFSQGIIVNLLDSSSGAGFCSRLFFPGENSFTFSLHSDEVYLSY